MAAAIEIKEYDGSRSISVREADGLVFLETGDHCFAFDTRIALHAMKRLFRVDVILELDPPAAQLEGFVI